MPIDFPDASELQALTFLGVQPVFFSDQRIGRYETFPVYLYREDATGELIVVAEDRYEEVLDQFIAMGVFCKKESDS